MPEGLLISAAGMEIVRLQCARAWLEGSERENFASANAKVFEDADAFVDVLEMVECLDAWQTRSATALLIHRAEDEAEALYEAAARHGTVECCRGVAVMAGVECVAGFSLGLEDTYFW